ncbi:pyrimidine-nucleoside phosphorylase [Desulfosporosinus sp. BICA1-9]|uniref:pyrimidine-nucleoside phosphorylase n=1 Tax=Desulfosporosinus sp. BICA1-9 TaxID=1531958 RepID=UPI00054B1161|nr:pyrimidine-nucleoside phosphorylase [Desulfosporosinus sp. BICA1-9]KJS49867.1 MAG: thymidine phosphorylase [Peptococcaceae bacterium BRH_c23]KJS81981.1 MAG: thymidine phosphorylase [Desulfosporosinus sp. BICA1-9]HBW35748.1 pyrimidine-nucleoside phosphorylase [Desulfosporosinus sp.]
MRMVDLIEKKREGEILSKGEIGFIIESYVQGIIPEYQMSAWAMAVYFRGMSLEETADLTMAMAQSGDQLDLSSLGGRFVDKHSTGGVGDKTTLLLGPMVAACGVPVAKMSGRGLGHTGGTIDKLSAVPGFRVELTREEFLAQVKKIGLSVIAQSGNLVPADKKLYALRDVTATVSSVPLIASSVMSKKIAAGAQGIILDVKYGSGAFMKTLDEARVLAKTMVGIGNQLGRQTIAVLSNMNQPLGRAVGNSLEILEVADALQGKGPEDLMEVSLELGAWMLVAGQVVTNVEAGKEKLRASLTNGAAWNKFLSFLMEQGGDAQTVADRHLMVAAWNLPILAQESGYVQAFDAHKIGILAMTLGAGRVTKESPIDLGTGVMLVKKAGEWAEAGEPILQLYGSSQATLAEGLQFANRLVSVGSQAPDLPPLIEEVIQ